MITTRVAIELFVSILINCSRVLKEGLSKKETRVFNTLVCVGSLSKKVIRTEEIKGMSVIQFMRHQGSRASEFKALWVVEIPRLNQRCQTIENQLQNHQ